MLIASDVSHSYGKGHAVLSNVSFSFPGPGLLVVTGSSGSGKTTLLNILGGILSPSHGEASFGGISASRLRPTWMFQTPNVLAHRTALDNAALGAVASGQQWQASLSSASQGLRRYGLSHVENKTARTLSGGEVQRLVLARAELSHARLILADEPTGQLDHDNSLMVAGALRRLADSGATVVSATHDQLVAGHADATITIVNGRASNVAHP